MQKSVFVKMPLLSGVTLLRKAEVLAELNGGALRVLVQGQTRPQIVAVDNTVAYSDFGRQANAGRGGELRKCYPEASGALANRF